MDEFLVDFCRECGSAVHWVECPTGGWWAHDRHPEDGHDARAPLPDEEDLP